MYKVILVDDEPIVIEGLVEMVSWESHGFKVSGMAGDGESALELIKTIQPDVVFTDIRMPGMDGLRLMAKSRQMIDKDILFVVLSGYSEFDYIKKAMDLQSFTYLLKPIDSDDINDELLKIRKKLDKKLEISERFEESVDVVLGMTLERLCDGQMKPSLIGRADFLMNLGKDDGYFMGVTSGKECIDALGLKHKTRHLFFRVQGNDRYFIMWGNEHHLKENLLRIKACCLEREDHSYVFVTKIQSSLADIKGCFQMLDSHQRFRFYEQPPYKLVTEEVIFFKDTERISHSSLFTQMTKPDQSEIDYQLSLMFHEFREKKMSPEVIQLKFEVFIDWMQTQLGRDYGAKTFSDFCSFKQVCKDAVHYFFAHLNQRQTNEVVVQIRQYVNDHMNEDLKLKTVAKVFGYNPVYLGQVFQKEMGIKYKEFIHKLRMDKAKELLLYSSLRIKEIADEIGFNNPDYFVKNFKEYEGVSPSEYRL